MVVQVSPNSPNNNNKAVAIFSDYIKAFAALKAPQEIV